MVFKARIKAYQTISNTNFIQNLQKLRFTLELDGKQPWISCASRQAGALFIRASEWLHGADEEEAPFRRREMRG